MVRAQVVLCCRAVTGLRTVGRRSIYASGRYCSRRAVCRELHACFKSSGLALNRFLNWEQPRLTTARLGGEFSSPGRPWEDCNRSRRRWWAPR